MATRKDMREYRGYLPVIMECEDALKILSYQIGKKWYDCLWYDQVRRRHPVRYRFGDIQETQFYMYDHTWHGLPVDDWVSITNTGMSNVSEKCRSFIENERKWIESVPDQKENPVGSTNTPNQCETKKDVRPHIDGDVLDMLKI